MDLMWLVPVCGLVALVFVIYLAWDVLRRDAGNEAMQRVGNAIYRGAVAFMVRQYSTIGILSVVTALLVVMFITWFERTAETEFVGFELGWRTGVAFLVGAAISALSGIIGMYVAVKSNQRVASAARGGVEPAFVVALRGGAVSGFLVVSLSLIGVYVMFWAYGGFDHPAVAPYLLVGMGFGASFVALFAQLGGGIYTKAADVGADLVGKVEANIPEDDPRNAAVVADLVGDNVGDCAGRGADLFESTVAENIGAMILGATLYVLTGQVEWVFFPLVVRSLGLLASIVGVIATTSIPWFKMHADEHEPMNALFRSYALAVVLSIVAMYFVVDAMLGSLWFFWAGIVGLITSVVIVLITMYYTESRWRPVASIAKSSLRGSGPNIITGLAVGMENTAAPVIVVGAALIATYWMGTQAAAELSTAEMVIKPYVGGIYGTAVATMGMLMTAAFVLAMDTFGPIVDNAGGIVEMSGAPEEIRAGTDALDAAGNTTKALTKGYAIGSAALAAFLLFSAYLDRIALVRISLGEPQKLVESLGISLQEAIELIESTSHVVDMGKVDVFVGAMLGAMLIFLFSSFAIRAVSRVAEDIIEEVRRQFREIPGLLEGEKKGAEADYSRAVDITTRGALRAMILPGVIAVATPILVGIVLRAEAAAAMLMAGTITGVLMATFMNNGGGAWDNAKKFIESGGLRDADGVVQGKGSEAHKAAVVGDTVGDPFKDTAGPSVHVLIKLLATLTLVLAPLFV